MSSSSNTNQQFVERSAFDESSEEEVLPKPKTSFSDEKAKKLPQKLFTF